jgi:hypothetical protein
VAINVYEYTGFALAGREENLLYGTNISFLIELLTFFLSALVPATTEKKACTSEPQASAQMFPYIPLLPELHGKSILSVACDDSYSDHKFEGSAD